MPIGSLHNRTLASDVLSAAEIRALALGNRRLTEVSKDDRDAVRGRTVASHPEKVVANLVAQAENAAADGNTAVLRALAAVAGMGHIVTGHDLNGGYATPQIQDVMTTAVFPEAVRVRVDGPVKNAPYPSHGYISSRTETVPGDADVLVHSLGALSFFDHNGEPVPRERATNRAAELVVNGYEFANPTGIDTPGALSSEALRMVLTELGATHPEPIPEYVANPG